MESLFKRENEKTIVVVGFFLICLFTLRNIDKLSMPSILYDEFGYLSSSAYLAGYDWSSVTSTIAYYSYGLGIFYAIPFCVIRNPELLYKVLVGSNAFLLGGSFLLNYRIGKILFPKESSNIIFGAAFAIAFFPSYVLNSQIAWSETMLCFLFEVISFLLLSLIQKPKIWKVVLLSVSTSYMYCVHMRSIGVVIALSLAMVFVWLHKKIDTKHLIIFGICMAICFSLNAWGKETIQGVLWNQTGMEFQNVQTSVNDYAGQLGKVKTIFTINGLKNLICSAIGKLSYILFASLFLVVWGILGCSKKIFSGVFSDNMYAGFYCFLVLSFAAMLGISSIAMIEPARIDTLIYGRYLEWAIGPLLLCGIVTFKEDFKKKKMLWMIGIGILLLTISVIILQHTGVVSFFTTSVPAFSFYNYNGEHQYYFLFFAGIGLSTISLFLGLLNEKNIIYFFLTLIVSWAASGNYAVNSQIFYQLPNQKQVKEIADELKQGEEKQIVCIIDEENSNAKYIGDLQYLLPDTQIKLVSAEKIKNKTELPEKLLVSNIYIQKLADEYIVEYSTNIFLILNKKE